MDEIKFISLDTSNINDIANDYFDSNLEKQKKSIQFIKELNNSNYKIILSLSHILELLAHKNTEKKENSFHILSLFNNIAIIKSKVEINSLGNILDIEISEIENILSNKYNLKEVITSTKKSLYSFIPGNILLHIIDSKINIYMDYAQKMNQKNKGIAFLSHSNSTNVYDNKLIDFTDIKINSPQRQLIEKEFLKNKLLSEIQERGDKKIKNSEVIVNNFILSLDSFDEDTASIKKYFLEDNNITENEYAKLKTFEEYEYLSIFKTRLKIISDSLNESVKYKIFDLEEKNCPTWELWKNLHKIRKKALKNSRIEGGNVNDLFLAAFVLYANLTVVDKRTFEYLNQLKKQKKPISSFINPFIKVSNYCDILKYL